MDEAPMNRTKKIRENRMLKIRLKRLGAKKNPTYRIIVINSTTKREGRPVQELGHYNPKTKVMQLDKTSALEWIKKGALISMPSAARFDEDFLVNGCKKVVDNYKLYEAWEEEYPYPTYDQVQIVGSKFTDLKQMGKITREDIIDVADVITGERKGRESEDEIIVYSVGGMPVEDIAWGTTVYRRALKEDIGVELPLWDKPEMA